MNRDALYVAILTVLCILVGVLIGAGINNRTNLPWPHPERSSFAERAEHFMGMGPMVPYGRGPGVRGGAGLFKMMADKLDLSQEQQGKVKEILDKTRHEIDGVGEGVRRAINEIKEKSDKEIMDILTPQQQEKFKELCKNKGPGKCPINGPFGAGGPPREYGPMDEDGPGSEEGIPPQGR